MAVEGYAVYQLKVTLYRSRPPIWRRVQVPWDITLTTLHRVIQNVMEWEDYHLHEFTQGTTHFAIPSDEDWRPVVDERRMRLWQVLRGPKDRIAYVYDFGDGWDHNIVLEKVLAAEERLRHPVCIACRRSAPPEDCGGIWGYYELLEAVQNTDHPQHGDMVEWLGYTIDPDACDLDEINSRLRRIRFRNKV